MNFRTSVLLAAFVSVPVLADLSEPAPEWWSTPIPRLDALARPDAGLPGQSEPAHPVADQAVSGGAYTRAFLRMVPEAASNEQVQWARRSTRFGLETIVGLPGGWALGLDAIDDQIIHRLSADDARWELAQPRGGLRIGAGVNVLQTFYPEKDHVWGWSVWAPLLDRTGELEVQTGFRQGRNWRVDATWATRLVRQKARRADSILLDTTTLRGQESRFGLRLGGQNRAGTSIQAWGGIRRVEDAREAMQLDDVGLASMGWFAGAQGRVGWKSWDLNWELRADAGEDTLRVRTTVDSAISSVEHSMFAARAALDAPWTGSVRFGVEATAAWLDLSNGEGAGSFPQLPLGVSTSGGGSFLRVGGAVVARVRTRWLDIVPRVGLHRERIQGELPQVWSSLWPLGEGSAWLGELGTTLRWSGTGTEAEYTIGGLVALDGDRGASPGVSHRLALRQGF